MLWKIYDFNKVRQAVVLIVLVLAVASNGTILTISNNNIKDSAPDTPELRFDTAVKLCRAINTTLVPHRDRYLWTPLQSENSESSLTVVPICTKFSWSACLGKTRYPLGPDCGHWKAESLPTEECEVERKRSEGGIKRISTKRTDVEEKPSAIVLDHTPAIQLCTTINSLNDRSDSQVPIKYVPIRVDISANAHTHFSRRCVFWKFSHCDLNEEQASSSSEPCSGWKMFIKSTPECEEFGNFYPELSGNFSRMSKKLEKHHDRTMQTLDFFEESRKTGEISKSGPGLNLDQDVGEASFAMSGTGEIDSVSDLIVCKFSARGSYCTILPKQKNERTKRDNSQTRRYRRSPRRCCDVEGCFQCSGLGMAGRSYAYPRPCDCGGEICLQDDFLCTKLRVHYAHCTWCSD